MFKKILIILSFFGITIVGLGSLVLYWLVAVNPGENLSRGYLQQVLAVESPVYYRDGKNKIGVFFEGAHRQYLPFHRIPSFFTKAIVAAEDSHFYEHWGVDFLGIARAMYANLKAGRVVQGGSTLTQQTAKNLYKRQGRSFRAKFGELLNAWRLEYHYTKEDILEFYANQFYVSGNGLGLGVAARYYFDKPASELTLVESAFIAGSVKRPNYYNPFIQKNDEKKSLARQRAKQRCRYVLDRMLELGMIDAEEFQKSIIEDVPFQQGRMSYSVNTIMDMVKEALAEPEIEEALVAADIDNISTSGVRIVTTIEQDIQQKSHFALRKELSRLSVRLAGYDSKKLQILYGDLAKERRSLNTSSFLFGRIKDIGLQDEPFLTISLVGTSHDREELAEGVVDVKGLNGLLSSLVRYDRYRWSAIKEGDMAAFMAGFAKGDLLYVSVREYDAVSGRYLLDLERYPEIQGGLVAMQKGVIVAMVGGNENTFFNRVRARRLMGSVAKPLLYTAAIQLGWNSLDILDNSRAAFVYSDQTYFPSPDHHSPYEGVSMNWAGAKSENVASVWLLYHLCDRLTTGQFDELLTQVGLARQEGESYEHYRVRIRDKHGVLINQEKVASLAMSKAIAEIDPDLLFAGNATESDFLHGLHYNFADELVSEEETGKEAELRRQIVKTSYLSFQELAGGIGRLRNSIDAAIMLMERRNDFPEEKQPDIYVDQTGKQYAFGHDLPTGEWRSVNRANFIAQIRGNGGQWAWDSILLDGKVSLATFNLLRDAQAREYQRLSRLPRYSNEVLSQMRDFRVLAGLRYLIELCREMGIKSPMEPVLSFPLGSNVVTVLDVARAYNTLVEGTRVTSGRADAGDGLFLIDRIESHDGKVIYRPPLLKKKVVDPYTSLAVTDILRNVVRYGTGGSAHQDTGLQVAYTDTDSHRLDLNVSLPVLGKTGTANGYRNSSFAGFLPLLVAGKNKATSIDGYVVSSYIGYDDNRPMVRNTTRISGSAGALPVWNRVVNAIINREEYAADLDLPALVSDSSQWVGRRPQIPLVFPNLGQMTLPEDNLPEIVVDDLSEMSYAKRYNSIKYGKAMTVFAEVDHQGKIHPKRHFKPYWKSDN